LTAVGADVTYCNLQSSWGHDAFLLEVETMTRLISDFLERIVGEHKISLPQAVAMPLLLPVEIPRE
jgi:homoserine O-acetyltransferase